MLKALLEKRKALSGEVQRLRELSNTEGRAWTTEDEAAWVKVNTDYNENERKIALEEQASRIASQVDERREAAPGREDRTGNPAPAGREEPITEEERMLAFNGWARSQFGMEQTDETLAACRRTGLNPHVRELEIPLLTGEARAALQRRFRNTAAGRQADIPYESRAMSNFIGTTGAFLNAPTNLIRQLDINMLAFGGMEQVAEIITTASGERMAWPTADDTSNVGVQLGENTTIGSSVEPTFGQQFWDAYKFSSKPVLVPYELIQDSQFDIAGLIGAMLGERLGRISNTKFTTGTGGATPYGITNRTSVGKTTSSATAIASDEILDLIHSVDPAYRNGARFMFHDGILLALRKLKDGQGRYLWSDGMGDAPGTLWGYDYTINQDMQSTVATATKTMIFGQLSKYKIRRVGGVRLYRLQERYRDTDQDGFVAFIRQDGNLLATATASVKHMLQA